MAKYARLAGDHLVDVTSVDPIEIFHPDVAALFFEVPDDVENGAVLVDDIWVNRQQVDIPDLSSSVEYSTVDVPYFYGLLHPQEEVAIDKLRKTDELVNVFMRRLEKATSVNLSLLSTQNGIRYIVSKLDIIPPEEKEARIQSILSAQQV